MEWSICFLFSEKMKHLLLVPSISLLLDLIAFCWFTHAILPVLGNYLEMYGKFFIGHFHFMFVNCIIYWSMLVSPCFFFLGPLIIELFSWQWIADIWSPQAADGGPKSAASTVRSKSFVEVPFKTKFLSFSFSIFHPNNPKIGRLYRYID